MNPPIPNIYKNDDIDIDNYTQVIQDNEIDKENEGKTFEEVLSLLYSVHVKYVNELKKKYDHKLSYQKHLSEYNIQQLELDNKKLKLKIDQLEKQIQYNVEEPMKHNNEMKIVFEKELKHWQQQYNILKRHFKNYQVKAKERIEQWKRYSEYIKFENQKLQNEIIAKLPNISRNNIDSSLLMEMSSEKEKKIKPEPQYETTNNYQPYKKRKYSDSNNDQDIASSSPVIKTPSTKILEGLHIQNLINSNKKIEIKNEESNNYNKNNDNNYGNANNFVTDVNMTDFDVHDEFITPKKKISYNRNPNYFKQDNIFNNEIHLSSCTTVFDEGDNNIRILSSPTPSQENQIKSFLVISDNPTSTSTRRKSTRDSISRQMSNMSLKENLDINQDEFVKETDNNYKDSINSNTKPDEMNCDDTHPPNTKSNNNDSTKETNQRPLQRQNSMVLSKEQLIEMTESKQKEKIHLISKSKDEKNKIKNEDMDTIDKDLKNIIQFLYQIMKR
ncbi:hypothetical protein U3516DRAFT_807708 [Neocallimastix sp. 'constans']